MQLTLFIGSPKRPLCTVAFFCLLLGTGLSNAETLLDQDLRFLNVGASAQTKILSVPRQLEDIQTSESLPLASPSSLPNCSDGFQPQPLFTPKTMDEINGLRVLVDFIVNAQGRVESPLILESSGETNEKQVLGIIQQWRFRPAICNGVPTNVEFRVLFEGPRKRLPHPVASVGQSTQRIRAINGQGWL